MVIHGTKQRKDNHMRSLELPVKYPSRESKHELKESDGNMFKAMARGGNIQGGAH